MLIFVKVGSLVRLMVGPLAQMVAPVPLVMHLHVSAQQVTHMRTDMKPHVDFFFVLVVIL